jgi:uncharacterized protein YciI
MSPPLQYLSLIRPKHPDFLETMTPGEETVMGEYSAYVRHLFNQGKIILGGAATDGSIGILFFRADSAEEAQRIFDNDPAVKAGIGYPELHPFHIGMLSCR